MIENLASKAIGMDTASLFNLSHVSPNCTAELRQGTCESDPKYMKAICNSSVCGRHYRLKTTHYFSKMIFNDFTKQANKCTDKDKANCRSWAFNFEKNPKKKKLMKNNTCDASCNIKCCIDNDANCGLWASMGHCVLKPGEMLVNCKRSCGNCGFCKDRDNECGKKAEQGECTKNQNYMNLYCPKSCKVCG